MKKYYGEGDRRDMILLALKIQDRVSTMIRHLAQSDDPEWTDRCIHELIEETERFGKANLEFYDFYKDDDPPPPPPPKTDDDEEIPF